MEYQGVDGRIELFDDRLIIRRGGFVSFMSHGLAGDKTVLFASITAVELRHANALINGFIQFTIRGGPDYRNGALEQNSVYFRSKYNEGFRYIRDFVQHKIAELARPQQAAAPPHLSVADELEKLGRLKAQGLLNDAEFDVQKRRLLGQ